MLLLKKIPNCYIQIAIRALSHEGISPEQILEGTDLTSQNLADGIQTNTEQLVRVITNARKASNNPAIGLLLGSKLHPSTHGSVGWAAINSPSLTEAVGIFERFSHLRTPFILYRPMISDNQYIIRLIMTESLGSAQNPFTEAMLLLLQHVIEFILGRPMTEGQLFINSKAPAYAESYSTYFSCPVHFDAPHLELRLPLALKNTLNPNADASMYRIALEQCEEMSTDLRRNINLSTEIHDLISSNLGNNPDLKQAAQLLNISTRTLIRKLKQQNTSFQTLKDEVYAFQAGDYLKRSNISIDALSMVLGYSDSANFRRAFKRWYHQTPQQYRNNISSNNLMEKSRP